MKLIKLFFGMFLMFVLIGSVSAAWEDNLNTNISLYFNMDFGTGTVIEDVTGNGNNGSIDENLVDWDTDGLLGNATVYADVTHNNITIPSYKDLDGLSNFTFSFWMNASAFGDGTNGCSSGVDCDFLVFGGTGFVFSIGFESNGQINIFRGNGAAQDFSGSTGTVSLNQWTHILVAASGNTTHLYINGNSDSNLTTAYGVMPTMTKLRIGSFDQLAYNGKIDEFGVWNRTLNASEASQLYNGGTGITFIDTTGVDVVLNSPNDNAIQGGTNIIFNSTLTPLSTTLINATIYIWNSTGSIFNKTTNALSGSVASSTTWNITNFSLGQNYHWNVFACSNQSTNVFCEWAVNNRSFTSSAFSEGTFIFNNSVIETERQMFTLNILTNPIVSSISSLLFYNGTNYTSTITDLTGGNYRLKNNIFIPLQNGTGNKTFYWQIALTLTDASVVRQNSTLFSHEVNTTYLVACNSTINVPFLNITTRNAENPFPLLNSTLKTAWEWSVLGGSGIKRTLGYEDLTETFSNYTFCMSPSTRNYTVSSIIEIDGNFHAKNFHYLDNVLLSNSPTNLNLYLLNDTIATLTVLKVRDGQQNPLENITISMQLYDVGTNTFYTIGMARTSSEGQDLAYLNWYDSLYKFIFVQNGTTIKTTSPYKISETPQIFEIITDVAYDFVKFEDFEYNLFYNTTTQNFVLTFVKPSGDVESGCLRVIKRNVTNDYNICNVCETSSSATLFCNIANKGNGTFIADFYATGSLKWIDTLNIIIGISSQIYEELGNLNGTVIAIIFSGVIMSFFLISPMFGVIGLLLGMLAGYALGFQPISYYTFLGIVTVGVIIIWFLKR